MSGARHVSCVSKNIKYITMKLDENERSTQIYLMKSKDMILEYIITAKKKLEKAILSKGLSFKMCQPFFRNATDAHVSRQ